MDISGWTGTVVSVVAASFSIYFATKSKRYSDQSLALSVRAVQSSESSRVNDWVNQACKSFQVNGQPLDFIDSLPATPEQKQEVYELTYRRHRNRNPSKTFAEAICERDQ